MDTNYVPDSKNRNHLISNVPVMTMTYARYTILFETTRNSSTTLFWRAKRRVVQNVNIRMNKYENICPL